MRWILLTLLFSLVRSQTCDVGQYAFNNVCENCPTGQFMDTAGHVFNPYNHAGEFRCRYQGGYKNVGISCTANADYTLNNDCVKACYLTCKDKQYTWYYSHNYMPYNWNLKVLL